jgi:hypothetical protein
VTISIIPFLPANTQLDTETRRVTGIAYRRLRTHLRSDGGPSSLKGVMAGHFLALARRGERDADRVFGMTKVTMGVSFDEPGSSDRDAGYSGSRLR